jgi:hypothetical protein
MAANTYEDKINRLIDGVADTDIKSILKVCAKNRMYPKDCLTNGSMEQLVNKILALEAEKKP